MKVTVTAEWQEFHRNDVHGHRIEVAGYTAVVEQVSKADWKNGDYSPVWQFTVLQDHLRIVEVGQRDALQDAKSAAEAVIQADIQRN
ncbi:hypothetical protein SEA_COLT_40 [Mycobacterium phage Colt]|uniref:Uncharacterized protein n=1 Tax=Mycobacterium phage Cane17 TaxID=2301548 RepID=A0A346N8L7_9CAUD|nr:hypothetical protein KHO59_gp038 [Mycobacterium phage Cane17]AXQ51652.1 hypothetical protein SEA_CANE17_38 [Mycobacterium phage Cane17]QAY13988.1 hypothetical protein SEA_COLT_40 [Mycobacterium phage Colt]